MKLASLLDGLIRSYVYRFTTIPYFTLNTHRIRSMIRLAPAGAKTLSCLNLAELKSLPVLSPQRRGDRE